MTQGDQSLRRRVGAECLARVAAVGKAVDDVRVGDLVIPLDRDYWVQRKVFAIVAS